MTSDDLPLCPCARQCITCGKYKTHTDRTSYWRLPNYLFMNVFRFVVNYNDRLNGGHRNNAMVVIPEKGLDMRPYVTGPLEEGEETLYDLHSLSMHIGYSILQSQCKWWMQFSCWEWFAERRRERKSGVDIERQRCLGEVSGVARKV